MNNFPGFIKVVRYAEDESSVAVQTASLNQTVISQAVMRLVLYFTQQGPTKWPRQTRQKASFYLKGFLLDVKIRLMSIFYSPGWPSDQKMAKKKKKHSNVHKDERALVPAHMKTFPNHKSARVSLTLLK